MGGEGSKFEGTCGARLITMEKDSCLKDKLSIIVDIVVGINTVKGLNTLSEHALEELITKSKGQLMLVVLNVISNEQRSVFVGIPNFENTKIALKDKLGAYFELEAIERLDDKIIRTMEVVEGSIGDECGLVALEDYVIFSLTFQYNSFDKFCRKVRESTGNIKLVVYSSKHEDVRCVLLKKSDKNKTIGCTFGKSVLDDMRRKHQQDDAGSHSQRHRESADGLNEMIARLVVQDVTIIGRKLINMKKLSNSSIEVIDNEHAKHYLISTQDLIPLYDN